MIYLKNVVSLRMDDSLCSGCGVCTQVCPHGVLEVHQRKARIAERDACMECGACRQNCPVGAVQVEPGVGCAYAILRGMVAGSKPTCGCSP